MIKKLLFAALSICLPSMLIADPIDYETAKKLALSCVSVGNEPTLVKKALRSEAKSRTLSEKVKSTSPYYIFSRGENKGFVIVSGDDCLPKILGYTENGNFDEKTLPPHLLNWLNHYGNLIEEAQFKGENVSRDTESRAPERNVLKANKVNVDPLVTAHWHQSGPYNNLCPFLKGTANRAVTGCVATAGAQIIYYYRKDNPSTLLATTPTYTYGDAPVTVSYPAGTPMKWDLMLDSYNGSRPAEYDDAVATFNAALGAATWLTYGSSTAGQISDLVNTFNSYFRASSVCLYKDGQSQSTWENLIYNELISQRPIVYSGVHPSSGGHAVVLDGYQASTNLYHFNFGWGGQGDGWYTVDDETGMNGFVSYQGMVYKIMPKKKNVSVEMDSPKSFYVNRTNEVKLRVENNGTLAFSGVYLFMNTNGKKPTSLSSAKDKDEETIFVPNGESVDVVLNCKPVLDKTCYIWVTDDNLNVFAVDTVETEIPKSKLTLQSMELMSSSDVENHGGKDYEVVYNSSKVTCDIEMSNNGDVDYEGSPRLAIYSSADGGNTFEYVGYKTGKLIVGAGESAKFSVNVANTSSCPIEVGKLYYGVMVNPIPSVQTEDTLAYANNDTIVRFTLKENDLVVDSYQNGCLKMKGTWDYNEFISISNKVAYKSATSFDLTEVERIGNIPVFEENPNALFYVSADELPKGKNVVNIDNSQCAELELIAGYDFVPKSNMKVENFSINIAQIPNRWYLFTSPCDLPVAPGMIARQIDKHTTILGINGKTTNVEMMAAGKTYLLITSSDRRQVLTAKNVEIVESPTENVDPSVIGTYVNSVTPAGALLVDEAGEYFEIVEEGTNYEAFRGCFVDEKVTRNFKTHSSLTLDPKYILLGQSIQTSYDVLEQYSEIVTTDACKELYDSIMTAEEVFSEMSITKANDVGKYADSLLAWTEDYKKKLDTNGAETEIDVTSFIVNPSFETGNLNGWTADNKTVAQVRSASNLYYKGVGSDGDYLLCNLQTSDSTGVSISQTITGLVPGTYRLSAMLGTDYGKTVTMFAGDKKVSVGAHDFGLFYLNKAVIDNIEVGDDGKLLIGVEAGDWYKADDFRLVCVKLADDNISDAIVGVTNEQDGLSISSNDDNITISTLAGTHVAIYSITGVKVWSGHVYGTEVLQMPSGIYLVNGKKVVVR